MMPPCSALYPAKRGTVQGSAAGLEPRIIPAGFDAPAGISNGMNASGREALFQKAPNDPCRNNHRKEREHIQGSESGCKRTEEL